MYFIAAFLFYIFLAYGVLTVLVPHFKKVSMNIEDEIAFTLGSLFVAAMAAFVWPLAILIAVPAFFYLRKTVKEGRW